MTCRSVQYWGKCGWYFDGKRSRTNKRIHSLEKHMKLVVEPTACLGFAAILPKHKEVVGKK